jgi:23S rRNA (guanosine2251-2'-O)-methyltransferase
LKNKRENVSENIYLAGKRVAQEIYKHAPQRIIKIFTTEAPEQQTFPPGFSVVQVRGEELDRLSFNQNHQGVVLEVRPQVEISLEELTQRVSKQEKLGPLVILDGITDPQNFGSILRVCECAGVSGVILGEDRSVPLSPVVRRISAGASELLNISRVKNITRSIQDIKKQGYWVVGTAITMDSKSIFQTKLPDPLAFVVGSEERGIRRLVKESCDMIVSIPMFGKMQSLNVSHALAVGLFEYRRSQID